MAWGILDRLEDAAGFVVNDVKVGGKHLCQAGEEFLLIAAQTDPVLDVIGLSGQLCIGRDRPKRTLPLEDPLADHARAFVELAREFPDIAL